MLKEGSAVTPVGETHATLYMFIQGDRGRSAIFTIYICKTSIHQFDVLEMGSVE